VVAPKIVAPADLKGNLSVFRASAAAFGRLRCWLSIIGGSWPERDKIQFRIVGESGGARTRVDQWYVDAAYPFTSTA